ncbi:MAG TPA: hypothetical protein VFR01_01580 [Geobacterales bacterium]|nr:hypothetical protein [Geobacterales bacterium]
MRRLLIAIPLTLLTLLPLVATASETSEAYFYPFVEQFNWREFDKGKRLLEESGYRFGLGFAAQGLGGQYSESGLAFKVNFNILAGGVDYDGQTQTGLPAKTDVTYIGTRLEGDLGWRFGDRQSSIEPFIGLGNRWWARYLHDTTTHDTGGNPVAVEGYTEYWQTVYTRLGGRLSFRLDDQSRLFFEGGARYPFYTANNVDFNNGGWTTVHPKGSWSPFAEAGFRIGAFRPSISYEEQHFRKSDAVGMFGVYQPESKEQIVSLNLGFAFR